MVKCSALLCSNSTYRKTPDISFHRFPNNVHLKNSWLLNMNRRNWQPTLSCVLCSKHFEAHLVDNSGFRSVLARDAIPTIFDLPFQENIPLKGPVPIITSARGDHVLHHVPNLQPSTSSVIPNDVVKSKHDGLYATQTPLGWCIHGCVRSALVENTNQATLLIGDDFSSEPENPECERILRELQEDRLSFAIESMGCLAKPRPNFEHQKACNYLEKTATLSNGRWYVGLPWKDEDCTMPDSYQNALKRLRNVQKKMQCDDGYKRRYTERMDHLFQNDYAEELKNETKTKRTFYLPHFGVDNPNKRKLRLVFDAAANSKGKSLNDYLLTSPDLLMSLLGIMFRFREEKIAVTADIRDMPNPKNQNLRRRINAAPEVTMEVKQPVILDGRHPITRLIVRYYHVRAAHQNQETVVNQLRQKYWIVRVRPTVKSVVAQCMLCRYKKAKPQPPRMGDLPEARLSHHLRPFTHCGLDLFGLLEVTVGRHRQKRYGVLFTCLTVRAIHIEIVHSLSSDALIMALRRMAARPGWPLVLYSDNGTNLRGADNELKKSILELDNDHLKSEAMNYGTTWTFIPPSSPHWGGAWERLIRIVKNSLKVILKERAPRDETFLTLIAEVEQIVNSRPLTHVSVEPRSQETLTPNHLLLGSSSNLPAIGKFEASDLYLRKQWRISQQLSNMFWKKWVKEILPDLIPRRKWHQEHRPLRVGDLVLIVDPASPRNVWPKGVIETVVAGKDGRIRVVDVRTKSGILSRPAIRVARIAVEEC